MNIEDSRPAVVGQVEPSVRPQGGDIAETLAKALRRAYSLGQRYWQQADSESYAENRRAGETNSKFEALIEETRQALFAHCRDVEQGTRHACSIAVWMTLMDALEPDADDKGLDGWMREAEQRVKLGPNVRAKRLAREEVTMDNDAGGKSALERGVRPLTPLQARIVAALSKMPGRRADWYDLGRMLWPMDKQPRAWNYSSNGGPPGWAMSLSRAVGQLQRAGIAHDDWKATGVRSVRLVRPNVGANLRAACGPSS